MVWDGYLDLIWKLCHCFHIAFDGGQENLAKKLKIPVMNLTSCWGQGLNCVRQVDEIVLNLPLEQTFAECKQPCFETKYDYQISNSLLSSASFASEFSMSQTNVQHNLIFVNFFFDSLMLQVVEENQKYTVDLFRYFGGIMSLFIGVSVVCLGEIGYFIVHYIHLAIIDAKAFKEVPNDADIRNRRFALKTTSPMRNRHVRSKNKVADQLRMVEL